MKKNIERWLAKKLKVKPENVMIKSINIKYDFINPDTFELTPGNKTITL